MPKLKKKKEIRFVVEDGLYDAIGALAQRRGETMADVCRRILERGISNDAAEDGLDTILYAVRKTMKDVLKPTEERLAKINAKTSIAAATSMYLNTQVIANTGHDARAIYEEARKKAVAFVRSTE